MFDAVDESTTGVPTGAHKTLAAIPAASGETASSAGASGLSGSTRPTDASDSAEPTALDDDVSACASGSVVSGSVVSGSVVFGSVVLGSVVLGSVVFGSVVFGNVAFSTVVSGSIVSGRALPAFGRFVPVAIDDCASAAVGLSAIAAVTTSSKCLPGDGFPSPPDADTAVGVTDAIAVPSTGLGAVICMNDARNAN